MTHDETVATRAGRGSICATAGSERDSVWADRDPPFRSISCYLYLASSFISQLFADGPCCVPSHAVASFLRVSDHTIERISMKAGSLILSHSRSPPARWHKQHHRAPGLETVFLGSGGRWNDCHCGRAPGEMLAYDVERAQKRFMPASTLKRSCPVLRSMPERSVTSSGDSVGWRNGTD